MQPIRRQGARQLNPDLPLPQYRQYQLTQYHYLLALAQLQVASLLSVRAMQLRELRRQIGHALQHLMKSHLLIAFGRAQFRQRSHRMKFQFLISAAHFSPDTTFFMMMA